MNSYTWVAICCDVVLASISWVYIVFSYMVVEYNIPSLKVCPFALLTGFRCPLCGTTRFIGMLLHGSINDACPRISGFLWFVFILVLGIITTARASRDFLRFRTIMRSGRKTWSMSKADAGSRSSPNWPWRMSPCASASGAWRDEKPFLRWRSNR